MGRRHRQRNRRRWHLHGRKAQVSAIATLFGLMLLVTMISNYLLYQLPQQMTQVEFQHTLQVENQLSSLQSAVYAQAGKPSLLATISSPITLGKMVRGSDLDIIVIAEDDVSKDALKDLDQAIFRKKYYLLVHPNYHEEIDYLVKDIAKVRQQLAFDSFQHMIASKIIHEGELLYGSVAVFQKIKTMVEEMKAHEKIAALEKQAAEDRKQAEISLLQADSAQADAPFLNLFYTSEEGDEIY
jgi:hypothetical protein